MKKIVFGKKQWIFVGLVVLLCVTGLVNYYFSEAIGGQKAVVANESKVTTEVKLSYYATFRADRKLARDQEIAYLDSVIADKKTDAGTIKKAQEQKLALVKAIETEMTVEGLIKAKGYSECVVTIRSGSVNVIVENTDKLTSTQAAQIFEIVRLETGEKSENIKIMPRN
jgi:stage III sporulation protein AH